MSGKEKTNGSLAMAPRVITIPAASQENTRKLRVAAYARVSSNSEDQKHSFAAQNAYYSKLITGNPDWELADIYADQGITGTSIDKRDDFLRMMEDCRKGRIDRILVKSSSRFARNTKESLKRCENWLRWASASTSRNRTSTPRRYPEKFLSPCSQHWLNGKVKLSPSECGGVTGLESTRADFPPIKHRLVTCWQMDDWKSTRKKQKLSKKFLICPCKERASRI